MKNRKIVVFSDFTWCALSNLPKQIKERQLESKEELKINKDYIVVFLPKNEFIPTQEFLEKVIEESFLE